MGVEKIVLEPGEGDKPMKLDKVEIDYTGNRPFKRTCKARLDESVGYFYDHSALDWKGPQ
jgi:hypothetical protein